MGEKQTGKILKPEEIGVSFDPLTNRYRTEMCEIWLDSEGMLHLRSLEAGFIMDLNETRRCFDTYRFLGLGEEKVLQVMDFSNPMSMNNEGKAYAAQYGPEFFVAVGMVSKSLSVRILFNFFNRFYKHDVPFRMFASVEDARIWLRTFRES